MGGHAGRDRRGPAARRCRARRRRNVRQFAAILRDGAAGFAEAAFLLADSAVVRRQDAAAPLRCGTAPARRGRARHAHRQSGAPRQAARVGGKCSGSPRSSTRFADAHALLKQDVERQRARGERAHRAGTQPARGADVGARAERHRVQRRGADPALQRAGDAAAAQAARRRQPLRARRTAWSDSGARSSPSSTATSSSTRSKTSATACARTRAVRSRASSPPRRRASSCACRSRRCWAAAADDAGGGAAEGITGFVLLLDNITRRIETGSRRDTLLQTLTQGTRASLASVRAAVETIASFPGHGQRGAQPLHRHHRRGGAADERRPRPGRRRIRRFAAHRVAARGHARRRPHRRRAPPHRRQARAADEARVRRRVDLDEGGQLFAHAGHHLRREPAAGRVRHPGGPLRRCGAPAARPSRPHLDRRAARVRDHDGVADRFAGAGRRGVPAHAEADRRAAQRGDLVPDRQAVAARVFPHRDAGHPAGGDAAGARHRGARAARSSTISTCSTSPGRRPSSTTGRSPRSSYTVFDTETTGLKPSAGDEIVSVGAVRIVNGRLLEHEVFEQLVDPRRRDVARRPSRITGIDAAMLESQPTIDRVLPAFGAVLRGHRAGRAQRGVRHALPAPQGGGDRRALHAAGARHAAPVGGDPPGPRIARPGGDRRADGRQSHRPAHGAGRRHHDRPRSSCA